jgi:hypothetical protein
VRTDGSHQAEEERGRRGGWKIEGGAVEGRPTNSSVIMRSAWLGTLAVVGSALAALVVLLTG